MNTQVEEALKMAIKEMTDAIPHLDVHFDDYFEAIQACKEALAQPAQEPVAWMFIGTDENKYLNFYKCLDEGRNIPLYAKENVDD